MLKGIWTPASVPSVSWWWWLWHNLWWWWWFILHSAGWWCTIQCMLPNILYVMILSLNNEEDATITSGNSNLIIINNLASDQKQQQLSSPNWFSNLITNSCPGRCSLLWFGMVMMVKLIFDRISALLLQSGTQVIFFNVKCSFIN